MQMKNKSLEKQKKYLWNILTFILICVFIQVIVFASIVHMSGKTTLKLEQVVILSRHNVRSPLSKNLFRITPRKWPDWKEKPGALTEKGYILEGYMGKYFSMWLSNEGLFPRNCPSEEDFYVYSNTFQRTMDSARAFIAQCFPNCNITIYQAVTDETDLIFNPRIQNSTAAFKEIAIEEMKDVLSHLNLDKSYNLMEDILKFNESDFCKYDNVCNLATDRVVLNVVDGTYPKVTGPLKFCNEAIDAFLMAYYEGFPLKDVAWGTLNSSNWHSILDISNGYHNLTLSTNHVANKLAQPLIKYLMNIFLYENTKVTLLMGHDGNINVLLAAMSFKPYELEYNFSTTPVGGKIVFQKWWDEKAKEYLLKIEYVYQSNDQLREGTVLSSENPPKFKLLELEHCNTDARGFCRWDDFANIFKQNRE